MTPIKDALEKRLSELVDLVNTTNRVATRINGKFVLDRDKVIPFVLGGLFTTPAPGRDELRERVARAMCCSDGCQYPDRCCAMSVQRIANDGRKLDAILSALPVAPVVGGWRNADDIPPVPKGQMREYVVAVKRAKTGKAYEFAACYLNGYPIEYRDCCPKGNGCDGDGCDDGCPTTGWFEQTGDDYYDTMFNQMSIGKDDTFLGWRELPRWEDRATAPVVDEAAIRADEREKCALIVERWSLPTIQTPSMWLVDKQGIAAEIRAGGGER